MQHTQKCLKVGIHIYPSYLIICYRSLKKPRENAGAVLVLLMLN